MAYGYGFDFPTQPMPDTLCSPEGDEGTQDQHSQYANDHEDPDGLLDAMRGLDDGGTDDESMYESVTITPLCHSDLLCHSGRPSQTKFVKFSDELHRCDNPNSSSSMGSSSAKANDPMPMDAPKTFKANDLMPMEPPKFVKLSDELKRCDNPNSSSSMRMRSSSASANDLMTMDPPKTFKDRVDPPRFRIEDMTFKATNDLTPANPQPKTVKAKELKIAQPTAFKSAPDKKKKVLNALKKHISID